MYIHEKRTLFFETRHKHLQKLQIIKILERHILDFFNLVVRQRPDRKFEKKCSDTTRFITLQGRQRQRWEAGPKFFLGNARIS